MQADITLAPDATIPPRHADPAPASAATAADRRLFRRYPAGLAAELAGSATLVPCRITDISLGGACVELADGTPPPALGAAELRSPEMAAGYGFPVEVRRVLGPQVHLSFALDDHADFELTMFLMHSPATLEGLEAG